jgi:hypothetical protein
MLQGEGKINIRPYEECEEELQQSLQIFYKKKDYSVIEYKDSFAVTYTKQRRG